MSTPYFDNAVTYFLSLQDRIIAAIEAADGSKFHVDNWDRGVPDPDAASQVGPSLGGYGRTRVLEGGDLIERGGVNFSYVHGIFAEDHASTMPGEGREFRATGVSLVLHPRNPFVPTVHMNYRRIERGDFGWFGGGADLTPYYAFEEDAAHFHQTYRAACDAHDRVDYGAYKAACDAYFHNGHRDEARGVGGIFFDHETADPDAMWDFVRTAGDAFLPSYMPIVERRRATEWDEAQRLWQKIRRGRYVEFNLVHDRGTTFGLKTQGRTESILMSMPPEVSWRYDYQPEPGSPEAHLLKCLVPRDWA